MIWSDVSIKPGHEQLILVWIIDLYGEEGYQIGYYLTKEDEYFLGHDEVDHATDYAVLYWAELPDPPTPSYG